MDLDVAKEHLGETLRRVMKRSKMRCECRGHCGMNHTEKHHVDGRCGLMHSKVYSMPYPDLKTDKWKRGNVTVFLAPVHANHDRLDCTEDNLMVFCQSCKNLHDSKHSWS